MGVQTNLLKSWLKLCLHSKQRRHEHDIKMGCLYAKNQSALRNAGDRTATQQGSNLEGLIGNGFSEIHDLALILHVCACLVHATCLVLINRP